MTVNPPAMKKTLAVTLALALGLSLPGGVSAQVFTARAVPSAASSSAGAASAASLSGMQTVNLKMPALVSAGAINVQGLRASGAAPAARNGAFAAPSAAPMAVPGAPAMPAAPAAVEAHPVIALINQLQSAGVALPETFSSHADAAKLEAAAQALPEGSAVRGRLTQLAASIRANAGTGAAFGALGGAFDGSRNAAPAAFSTPGGESAGATGLTPADTKRNHELTVDQVRYVPAAASIPEGTRAVQSGEQKVVGQDGALKAIRFALEMKPAHYNLFVAGADGSGREMATRRILNETAAKLKTPGDLVAATNFENPDKPVMLEFAPGKGEAFADAVEGFVEAMGRALPQELTMGETGQKKQQIMAQVQAAMAESQKEFDAKVASIRLAGKFGVSFNAQQDPKSGQVRIAYGPSYDGKAMTDEDVKTHIAAGAFTQAELDQAKTELGEKKSGILEAFQVMMQGQMQLMSKVQGTLSKLDEQAAVSLVNERANQLLEKLSASPMTEAQKAVAQRAQERDKELNADLQKLAGTKFGPFNVAVQAGVGRDGKPVLIALPALGEEPVTEENSAALIAAGKFTASEYASAKTQIARKATAIYEKMAEFLAVTKRERAQADASAPAPTPQSEKVKAYVQELAQAAAEEYKIFLGIQEGGEGVKPAPGSRKLDPKDFFRVSVLSDNSKTTGAPVVWEDNPTYERLFGTADGNDRNMAIPGVGLVKTEGVGGPSFKGGSYLKANGGFLVMRAMDVLRNPGSWQALMQAVRTGQAEIAEGGFMGMASKMEEKLYHVPAKVKIVLIGSPMIQMLLSEHDDDFAANFQGISQFQSKIDITEDAVAGFLNFLKHSVAGSAGEIKDLTRDAIVRVLQHAARLADSNQYFTAQFGVLHTLLQEATYWAQQAGREQITGADVETALQAKRDREEAYISRMMNAYTKGVFRVETSGEAVGQINGLAVMGSIGVPARVTFVAGPGQPGIVSTDKDAGSTGKSFNKALGNEWSYILHLFGMDKMPKVSVRVAFEQNYGGIDGDSATSTTIYGILSALSGVPIKQNFAVTGSADQFGNVQAIGGVNEKIEGFFLLCKTRGLTGDQGVIIPQTNVADLQLSPEVTQAIADGKFHIYAVSHVSQGIEILTGEKWDTIKQKAGERVEAINKSFDPKKDAAAAPAPGDVHGH